MKAVIKVGGKQVLASLGSTIYVEKINGNVGDTVRFNEVLMLDSKIGNPYVEGAVVEGKIEKQGKQKKILPPGLCSEPKAQRWPLWEWRCACFLPQKKPD